MRKAIDKNNTTKRTTAKRLRENERQAEAFNEQLKHGGRVTGAERRELLELLYKIGKLELENMQLEQAQFIHDSIIKGKDRRSRSSSSTRGARQGDRAPRALCSRITASMKWSGTRACSSWSRRRSRKTSTPCACPRRAARARHRLCARRAVCTAVFTRRRPWTRPRAAGGRSAADGGAAPSRGPSPCARRRPWRWTHSAERGGHRRRSRCGAGGQVSRATPRSGRRGTAGRVRRALPREA